MRYDNSRALAGVPLTVGDEGGLDTVISDRRAAGSRPTLLHPVVSRQSTLRLLISTQAAAVLLLTAGLALHCPPPSVDQEGFVQRVVENLCLLSAMALDLAGTPVALYLATSCDRAEQTAGRLKLVWCALWMTYAGLALRAIHG